MELYSRKVSRKVAMFHQGSCRMANAVCAGCDVSGLSFTEQYNNNEEELLNFCEAHICLKKEGHILEWFMISCWK